MGILFNERSPFDILVRNFLNAEAHYRPVEQNLKLQHPIDIFQDNEGLTFEIACTGIDKKDLEILTQDNILRVNYDKKAQTADEQEAEENSKKEYLYRGIAKRSFNLGWKIDAKFDLSKSEASFDNGLLTIFVPFQEESKIETLVIN